MPAITQKEIEAAYTLGCLVFDQKATEASAVSTLVQDHGMDRGSASGYVRQVGHFLSGKLYTRTINDPATRYYLGRIQSDFGAEKLALALTALASHIEYYENVAGAKRPSLRGILQEFSESSGLTYEAISRAFDHEVQRSLQLSDAKRTKQLPTPGNKPTTKLVTSRIFVRNPNIVAAALIRAKGICEQCQQPAPFLRKSDGAPFLEVHHITTLADLGDDTLANVVALCPNCHRQRHHG